MENHGKSPFLMGKSSSVRQLLSKNQRLGAPRRTLSPNAKGRLHVPRRLPVHRFRVPGHRSGAGAAEAPHRKGTVLI